MSDVRPVLIVEDHELVADALRAILSADREVHVVQTLGEAETQCAFLRPGIVLLDVELPDGDGVERLPALIAAAPEARFIMVSRHDSAAVVRAAYNNGAHAFLEKGLSVSELRERLQQAINGVPVFPVVEDTSGLSMRELQVLIAIQEHQSDKDAAVALGIALDTLRGHKKRIYRKLDVNNIGRAIAEARRRRLIP